MKRILISFFLILILFGSCTPKKEVIQDTRNYTEIELSARGTSVTFYMWGGSTLINTWVDTYAANVLKQRFDITLKRVPMDASVFISKLLDQKKAGKATGTMDLLWINGENFKNAMEAGLLYGPFTDKLPNFKQYVDPGTVEYDFGYPVNGYEAPYGKAQFVFEYDSAKIPEPPNSFKALLEWVKEHPGRFTYPQPPDFTGSAFIRQAFCAMTGGYDQYMKGFDKGLFDSKAPMLWEYLNEMKPYLWQKGNTYPKDIAALDTLFERGEVDFNMSYHQTHAQNKIINGQYPETVRTFVMVDGSIFNTHFLAIPFNAPNKDGAIAVINHLLSPEMQYNKNLPNTWGDFTVLDLKRLIKEQQEIFYHLDLGEATLPLMELAAYAMPEISSAYLEMLEQGWEENVLKQ